jgi:phospholipase A1
MKYLFATFSILLIIASNSRANVSEQCLLDAFKAADPHTTIKELTDLCALAVSAELVNAQVVALDDADSLSSSAKPLSVVANDDLPAITIGDERAARLKNNSYLITPYDRNYILPFSYNDSVNPAPFQQLYEDANVDDVEVKFQLSIQAKAVDNILSVFDSELDLDLWVAYTQRSWWQLYNQDQSAPFRETNYEPEVFFRLMREGKDNAMFGFTNREISFGYTHQSNGRGTSLSRSWNRLFVSAEFDKDNWLIIPRVWWRIPENEKDDDNPDISEYMGYGDLKVAYQLGDHLLTTTITNNLRTNDNRGSAEIDWSFPFPWTNNQRFKGFVQYYTGYGESLIDYNEYTNRFSIGVLLTDW